MAMTSLGFNIFSTYNGSAMARARRDIHQTANAITRLDRHARRGSAGLNLLKGVAIATSPALIGMAKGALLASGALGAMFMGAGAAAGIFGIAMMGAIKHANSLRAAGAKLTTAQAAWIRATDSLSRAWVRFIKQTSAKTLAPATVVVRALARNMHKLIPIINAVHPVAMKVARAFARWMAADKGLKRFVNTIVRFGVPALDHLQRAARHALGFLGHGFRAFAPQGVKMAAILERGARALRRWAAGGGFQRFIASARKHLPAIRNFFSALGGAIRQVSKAMAGLGPLAFGLATALLRIISVTPVPVLQAIVVAYGAWKVAVAATTVATTAQTAVLGLASTGLLGHRAATWADTVAQRANNGSTRAGIAVSAGHTIALGAHAVAQRASAAATWLHVIAQRALRLVMLLSPWGLVIAGIALLVAAIVWIATKTNWFQNIWRVVWTGIKIYALFIWRLLRTYFRIFMIVITTIAKVFMALISGNWGRAWNLIKGAALRIWALLRGAWGGFFRALMFVARVIGSALLAAWRWLWGGIRMAALVIWGWLRRGWNAVKNFFIRVARFLGAGVRIAWRFLWNGIRTVGLTVWGFLRRAWNAVKNFFIRVARFLGNGVRAAWRFLWGGVRSIGLAVWGFLRRAWNSFKNAMIRVGRFISSGVRAAWNFMWGAVRRVALAVWNFLRNAWNAVKNFFIRVVRFLGAVLRGVWNATWGSIRRIAVGVWNFLKNAWNTVKNFFINKGRQLWVALKAEFARASNWLRNTFWNPVKNFFTKTIPNAFKAAVRFIGRAWNLIKRIISKPVKAVVDVVWNNGLRKLWNVVAGVFGAKGLKPFKFKGFQGGGYTGNMGKNEVAGVVHGQEYVIPYDQLKAMGGPKAINKMGPQALFGLQNGEFNNTMAGMSSVNPGTNWTLDRRYQSSGLGSVGGLPVAGDGPFDFLSSIGDFFKAVGGGIKSAFSAATGWSSKALKALAALDMCGIAEIVGPLIDGAAKIARGAINGIIPGAPPLQRLFTGTGKKKSKNNEGNQGNGAVNVIADTVKNWILSNANCMNCGFTEFRKWKAGDGRRAGASDVRTMAMLSCARKAGFKGGITQGSWSHAGASAGTHAGGGTLDLSPANNKNVGALRSCGFAAWNRGAKWGSPSFSPHIHAVAVGNKNLAPGAAAQVRAFKAGRNGLAGNGPDNFNDNSCSGGKSGNCNSFRPLAARALAQNGLGGQNNLRKFMSLMKQESGCKTGARNNWDSNARAGNASVGLMQVIPTTFRANKCKNSSNNIMDPWANICASARYIKRRYGSVPSSAPYRSGTSSATPGWHMVGESGPEMVRFAGGETVRTASATRRMTEGSGVTAVLDKSSGGDVHIHLHGNVYAKSEMDFEKMLAGAMQNLKRKGRLPK